MEKQIASEKLLIAEYEHFSESFWKNEELGEKRVNFYITLATAVIGGIVVLVTSTTSLSEGTLQQIASGALLATALFGLATFFRMLKRNRVTDEYKKILKYLREQLRSHSHDLHDYKLPFQTAGSRTLNGGLAESVAAINSILLAVVVAIWLGTGLGLIAALGTFGLTFALHMIEAKSGRFSKGIDALFLQNQAKPSSQRFRAGVGAVIVNHENNVLALERNDIKGAWQLPQGGLELGEEPLDAAYREVLEETGINSEQLDFLLQHSQILTYELPETFRSQKTGRGQAQYWFMFRLNSTDDAITLGDKVEFSRWQWMAMDQLLESVSDFRRPVYKALAKEFFAE